MPEAANSGSHTQDLHLTLNSDGERHPVVNAGALFSFVGGVVAFALGIIVRAHAIALILGIVVFGIGMLTQMNTATREQRIITVAGIIGAFLGIALGVAHGGFY
jgi:hypothetical protein